MKKIRRMCFKNRGTLKWLRAMDSIVSVSTAMEGSQVKVHIKKRMEMIVI